MPSGKSKVVWVKTKISTREDDPALPVSQLQEMLEIGLKELTGRIDPAAAWSRYFHSKDIIGIKVNCLGGPNMSTHPALVKATVGSLQAMGITLDRIIVWDRTNLDLRRGGYTLNKRGKGTYRCFGTDESGFGYERDLTIQGSIGSLYSTLLTRHCSATINMPILKDHALCGLTASLKNIFGALHNPNKYHEDHCNPFIADANAVPLIQKKHRLVICDALRVQYKGGPAFHSQWTKPLGSILLAEDPVAIDSTCVSILNEIRTEQDLPPIEAGGELPAYIKTAADKDHNLGRCRAKDIELIKKHFR